MRPAPVEGGPSDVEIRAIEHGVVIPVRVIPRASRDAVGGARGGALLVRLTAPPVDGAANAALVRLIGAALGVPASAVRLASGATSRHKRVEISGLDAEAARDRLRSLASPGGGRARGGGGR